MSKSLKCGCVIATADNTASVLCGFEMGGYVKEFCAEHARDPGQEAEPVERVTPYLVKKYSKYYIDVSDVTHIDAYDIQRRYGVKDDSGCLQHSGKKLLLSGVRTGGKPAVVDVKEARDTLNRWLELDGELESVPPQAVPGDCISVPRDLVQRWADVDAFNAPRGAAMELKTTAQLMLAAAPQPAQEQSE